jgi:hypothetical protein
MMNLGWKMLLQLAAALGIAILVIYAIHIMFGLDSGSRPERLVAAMEIAVLTLICVPLVLNEVVRLFRLMTGGRQGKTEEIRFRFVFCLLVGLAGSVGVYWAFLHFQGPKLTASLFSQPSARLRSTKRNRANAYLPESHDLQRRMDEVPRSGFPAVGAVNSSVDGRNWFEMGLARNVARTFGGTQTDSPGSD